MLAKDGIADPYSFKYLESTKGVEGETYNDEKEYKGLIEAFEVPFIVLIRDL